MVPLAKVTQPQDPGAVVAFRNLKDRVQSEIQKYRGVPRHARPQRQPMVNDFSRLARRLCGKSIGLVLGGGGARGLSHLVCIPITVWDHHVKVEMIGFNSRTRRTRYSDRLYWRHEHRGTHWWPVCTGMQHNSQRKSCKAV